MLIDARHVADKIGDETIAAFGKLSPPVTVSALSIAGVGLQDWLYILTGLYTALQLLLLTPKLIGFVRRAIGALRHG